MNAPAVRQINWRNRAAVALLTLAYLALVLFPVALAAAAGLPRRPLLDELSSGLAMAGFTILLVEFFLSGRYRAVSTPLGLDVTIRYHQLLSYAAVAFLILHPALYTLPVKELPTDYTRAETISLTPTGTVTGLVAWALLLLLPAFATFRDQPNWRYETWRLTHGFGAAALAVAGAWHAVEGGRYSAFSPALEAFWIVAAAFALAALTTIYLVRPILHRRRPYRVAATGRAAERTWRLVLEPAGRGRLRFDAGQSMWLKVGRSVGRIADYPFSIASTPGRGPALEFLIKEEGDFSSGVGHLANGTPVYIDGPYGNFTLRGRAAEGFLLVAGGIGIAPILSLLRELADRGDRRSVLLVYGNRTEAQICARDELEALKQRLDLRVEHVLAEPPAGWQGREGLVTREMLDELLPREGRARWLSFICGPPAMIDSVEICLGELGLPLRQVVSERFRYDTRRLTPREKLITGATWAAAAVFALAALAFALR
ncbi:MAG TPA: ferredoxin reductase family protein [Pelomicrobium sp.]|nr:ferredoxin reductase family protein [Pelomicrobium sp.]